VSGEPDVATVDDAVRQCREAGADVVVAVGGGSALDAAKAVAGMAPQDGSVRDYLEQVGDRKLTKPPLPFVAVPTTAGSGSEATKNAVIRVPDLKVKRSLRHDQLIPRVAIVDPDLSAAAPRPVAASAGLDAFTHLLEGYVSTGATPMTDALALPGIRKAAAGLRRLAEGKPTSESQESMALASLWGGMVLANAGLGAVHGLVRAPRRAVRHSPRDRLRVPPRRDDEGQPGGPPGARAAQRGPSIATRRSRGGSRSTPPSSWRTACPPCGGCWASGRSPPTA
jgi:alcohol dehydrogenase class IV